MSAPTAARPGAPAAAGSWDESWASALTALELDVAAVEEMLSALHEDADSTPARDLTPLPVADLGPIPMSQVERARVLLARQQEAAAALAAAMTTNRRQQRLATSLHRSPARPPIYVDTAL